MAKMLKDRAVFLNTYTKGASQQCVSEQHASLGASTVVIGVRNIKKREGTT